MNFGVACVCVCVFGGTQVHCVCTASLKSLLTKTEISVNGFRRGVARQVWCINFEWVEVSNIMSSNLIMCVSLYIYIYRYIVVVVESVCCWLHSNILTMLRVLLQFVCLLLLLLLHNTHTHNTREREFGICLNVLLVLQSNFVLIAVFSGLESKKNK